MSWLLWNTGAAALLALVVAGICRAFRPRPAVAHLMWLLVLLKLACPPLSSVELPPTAAAATPRAIDLMALLSADVTPTPAAPDAGFSWTALLFAGWLLGSVVFCGALLAGIVRMHRRLRRSDTPSEALIENVRAVAQRLGVRVPLILRDPACSSPFVWSIGRARLVLPRALDAMSARSRDALLTHELAHLRRGDHWIARLEALLAIALWWHPLFWLARDRMRQQAELACDAWVLSTTPESRFAYADALIASLEPRPFAASLPILAARTGDRAAFERRLTMILNENVPCRLSGRVLAPLCALTLGLFAAPMLAQGEQHQERHHEITVNGKQLSELNAKERQALLEALRKVEAVGEVEEPKVRHRPEARPGHQPKQGHEPAHGHEQKTGHGDQDHAAARKESLRGARKQGAKDPELKAPGGIGELIDRIAESHGHWFDEHLHRTLVKALQHADEATAELGKEVPELGASIKQGLHALHANKEILHGLHATIAESLHAALHEAHAEIAKDPDLERLGITEDVQDLVSGLLDGKAKKDFSRSLGNIIQKSIRAALDDAKTEPGANEGADTDEPHVHVKRVKPKKSPPVLR